MLVNRADSHTSAARFVRQPARWPKPLPKKTTPPTWLNFTRNFAFYQNPKTLCEPKRLLKKDELYFEPKQLLKRGNILCWPERLLKKGDFYFYQNLCWKKTSRFWKPTKPTTNTARKNDTTNQNHRRPKRKRKTLKPILATRQNQPELTPTKKPPPNEKAENLKTCLLKNI